MIILSDMAFPETALLTDTDNPGVFENSDEVGYPAGMKKKGTRRAPVKGPNSERWLQGVDSFETRINAAGFNLTQVCKRAKISRANPTRWRTKVPKTIATMDKLEKAFEQLQAERAAALAKKKK